MRLSVRAFAEHLGVAPRTVSKWENHGAATFPLPDTQAILDTALSRADEDAKQRFELLVTETPSEEAVDSVNRRTVLGLLGPAMSVPLTDTLEILRRNLDGMLATEPSGRDADDWEQAVRDYAHQVGALRATELLPGLVIDFAEIHDRIAEASGFVRVKLIHSAAQLAALTAIALVNLEEPRPAERWWRTAARASDEASDPTLSALVRGRHAIFSLYGTPASRVLSLAADAIALGHGVPCTGVISGLAARAQALAALGRHAEARHTLHAVTETYERLPAETTEDQLSQWNWAEQRLRHVESHVHTHAGRLDHASQAQDLALALYPLGNYQGRTQIELHRAEALIRSGDTPSGTRHLITVLEQLSSQQRGDGIVISSAMSTLETVPLHQRDLAVVAEAHELLTAGANKW